MDNLEALKDIHLPDAITRFPLGWGVVMILCALALAVVLLPFLYRIWLKSKKRYALKNLNKLTEMNMDSVCTISELLRRICILKYPDAVALSGKKWIDFLRTKTSQKIEKSAADILSFGPYMPKDTTVNQADFEALKNFARTFLEDNL